MTVSAVAGLEEEELSVELDSCRLGNVGKTEVTNSHYVDMDTNPIVFPFTLF